MVLPVRGSPTVGRVSGSASGIICVRFPSLGDICGCTYKIFLICLSDWGVDCGGKRLASLYNRESQGRCFFYVMSRCGFYIINRFAGKLKK